MLQNFQAKKKKKLNFFFFFFFFSPNLYQKSYSKVCLILTIIFEFQIALISKNGSPWCADLVLNFLLDGKVWRLELQVPKIAIRKKKKKKKKKKI